MVLTILEAFPKDAGTYSIQVSNNAGTVSGTCTVSVKGRLPAETSDSELASDLEPTKPSVPMRLKDTTVVEGERVRLDCIIVGQPEPEVLIQSKDNTLYLHTQPCTICLGYYSVFFIQERTQCKCNFYGNF